MACKNGAEEENDMMVWFLFLVLVVIFGTEQFYRRQWKKGLTVKISFLEKTAYAGERVTLEEAVINQKRLPLPQLEVGFRVPKGLHFMDAENIVISDYVYKRDVFSLRGMEKILRRYQVICEARGRYPVSSLTLHAKSLLQKHPYTWEIEGDGAGPSHDELLLVYAGYTDVTAIEKMCDNLLGEMESRSSLYEDPFLFAGIRDYSPSDPMNRVNWKAMARTGELMVNTYASVQDISCMIYLDVADQKISKEKELVEESIRIAASLCRRMISRSSMTGLAVNSDPPICFTPERGRERLAQIEYILTGDFNREKPTDFCSLFDLVKEKRSGINMPVIHIVISKNLREEDMERVPSPAVLVSPDMKNGELITNIQMHVQAGGKSRQSAS